MKDLLRNCLVVDSKFLVGCSSLALSVEKKNGPARLNWPTVRATRIQSAKALMAASFRT